MISYPLRFDKLNHGWNAYPNGSDIECRVEHARLITRFPANTMTHGAQPLITLTFDDCASFRVTPMNDHGFYLGQCRFSGSAPAWGEFYEISGNTRDAEDPTPWQKAAGHGTRHFHFYQRDETLEVKASSWRKEPADP